MSLGNPLFQRFSAMGSERRALIFVALVPKVLASLYGMVGMDVTCRGDRPLLPNAKPSLKSRGRMSTDCDNNTIGYGVALVSLISSRCGKVSLLSHAPHKEPFTKDQPGSLD